MSKKMILGPNELIDNNNEHNLESVILFKNPIKLLHYRRVGVKKRKKLIGIYDGHNGITNVGRNLLLNVMFNDATQIANASWYLGLIDNAGFTALAAADTMASHAGWAEWTSYTQANRVAWGSGTSTAQSTTNASPATFDLNASGTLLGMFATTNNTKGGTTGQLWATGAFSPSTVPVSSGDEIKLSYTITD